LLLAFEVVSHLSAECTEIGAECCVTVDCTAAIHWLLLHVTDRLTAVLVCVCVCVSDLRCSAAYFPLLCKLVSIIIVKSYIVSTHKNVTIMSVESCGYSAKDIR